MKRLEKYVVLEHLTLPDRGLRFWSHNTDNNTHGYNGELWYKEVLFTDSEDEAMEASRICNNLPTHHELEEYWKEKIKQDKQQKELMSKMSAEGITDISAYWEAYYKNQHIK